MNINMNKFPFEKKYGLFGRVIFKLFFFFFNPCMYVMSCKFL